MPSSITRTVVAEMLSNHASGSRTVSTTFADG